MEIVANLTPVNIPIAICSLNPFVRYTLKLYFYCVFEEYSYTVFHELENVGGRKSACFTVQMKSRNILRGGLNELPAINRKKLLVKVRTWFCSLMQSSMKKQNLSCLQLF